MLQAVATVQVAPAPATAAVAPLLYYYYLPLNKIQTLAGGGAITTTIRTWAIGRLINVTRKKWIGCSGPTPPPPRQRQLGGPRRWKI